MANSEWQAPTIRHYAPLDRRVRHALADRQRVLGGLIEADVLPAARSTPSARAWVAGSMPCGVLPFCTACAALRSRCRAMMMALSVETRFSLRAILDRAHVFLQRGVLHADAFDAAVVAPAFCAARSIR